MVFDMPESYIRTGALLVVNWGGVDQPEFRLGKVTSLVDDGPYLQVVVALGSGAKRRKYEFTETALGIVGFFRHDRAKRISNLARFWLGKESVFDCVDSQDWISREAIKRYYGNDAEVLATQKEVRDWIFENDAVHKAIEEGELKPGKWHYRGGPAAKSERPTDEKESSSLPKGFAPRRMTNDQVKMVHKLDGTEDFSFLMDTVVYQSEVEDDFVVDFEFLGDIYRLSSPYDERVGDKWDVELVEHGSLEVDAGTIKDVLDWIEFEHFFRDMDVDTGKMTKEELIDLVLRLRTKIDELASENTGLRELRDVEKQERVDVPKEKTGELVDTYASRIRDLIQKKDNLLDVYMTLKDRHDEESMEKWREIAPRRAMCEAKAVINVCKEHGFRVLDHWEWDWDEEQREREEFLDHWANDDKE